jgi:pilus assembly protein CpaB
VRISAENTAGGFILPGDRVDVILTVAQEGGDAASSNVSRTILTSVKVMAIDQTVGEEEGQPVVLGKTATLELLPAQAELVTSAQASGALSLALRSMADTDQAVTAQEDRPSNTIRFLRNGRSLTTTTQ